MLGYLVVALLVLAWVASAATASPLQFADLPSALKVFLPGINTGGEFNALRDRLLFETEQRLQEGEREALVYYVLQAKRFTSEPSVEPALAARQFVENETIVPGAERRIAEFQNACVKPRTDERLHYFRSVSDNGRSVRAEYPRTMRFLYEKEFQSRAQDGDKRREFVASLYQTRGLSTDSSFDANFPVYMALRSFKGQRGFDKVLIVGPGLEFAPRTGLKDEIPPQSLQPYAVADALLQLGISRPERLRIDCVDVNPRVVQYLNETTARRLTIFVRSGTEEYQRYLNEFGRAIGKSSSNAAVRTVELSREIAGLVTAGRLNILTEHQDGLPAYDLIVATNVLLYFKTQEVALAFANVHCMLRDGGFFIHNDLRGEIDTIGRALHMPIANARMLRLREDERRAIFDAYVVHKKDAEI
jgi:CheR methyltransferase, SAM binding domain